jgi:hypothetical protein
MTMRNFFYEPLLIFHYSTYFLPKFSNVNNIMAALPCMYKIEHRVQICLRNPIIACSTDLVGNIPLRKLNFNFKNKDDI